MPFYEKGNIRIHYEEAGKGFPLLVIPGGGLNSTIGWVSNGAPFDAIAEFGNEYRVVTSDLRYAPSGQSTGPLDVERPWDSITDDQLALMDHIGAQRFMVLGYCIGGPMIWNLIRRAPDRVVAAVLSQPSGWRKELPNLSYESNMKGWGPDLVKKRPEITMEQIDRFLTTMYRGQRQDFVYTVSRDFVRSVKTPLLVMPDDSPPHPFTTAMESVMLAPNSEVSIFPWKEPRDRIPIAVRQVRSFLRAHAPPPA
jgi:pimeloyl-ACP methyl ester carboxylesterase